MHKFRINKCVYQEKDGNQSQSPVIVLSSVYTEHIALFFPVSENNASLINFVIDENNKEKINIHQDVVGIYKTMIDSWKSGDRFISGIIIDTKYDPALEEEILDASAIIINADGELDVFVKTSFIHAIVVAAMEDITITVTNELFQKIYSELNDLNENDNEDDNDGGIKQPPVPSPLSPSGKKKKNPTDENVAAIAKKIIDGNSI